MCVSMFVRLSGIAFLAGRRAADGQTPGEGGLALCLCARVKGNNQSLLYAPVWSTFAAFALCFGWI